MLLVEAPLPDRTSAAHPRGGRPCRPGSARHGVADHPRASADLLERLLTDPDPAVADAAAANPALPQRCKRGSRLGAAGRRAGIVQRCAVFVQRAEWLTKLLLASIPPRTKGFNNALSPYLSSAHRHG